MLPRLLALCAGLGSAGLALAHDFWIEPSDWKPAVPSRIGVTLCIGERFQGWSSERNAARIEEFFAADSNGRLPVIGLDGVDPAGSVRFAAPGGYVIGYRSNRAYTELPRAKFEDYLREKGLEPMLAARTPPRRAVREAYSRFAKSLVSAGGAAPADRTLGFRLELVAERDGVDGLRPFRLLFDGRPLADALVIATRRPAAAAALRARTDGAGRVRLSLGDDGAWLVTAVHMVAAPSDLDADVESFWASLSFDRSPRPARVARCDRQQTLLAPAP